MKVVKFHHLIVFTWQSGSNFNRAVNFIYIWQTELGGKQIIHDGVSNYFESILHNNGYWLAAMKILIYEDRTQSRLNLIKFDWEVSSSVSKIPWRSGRPRKRSQQTCVDQVRDKGWGEEMFTWVTQDLHGKLIRFITTILFGFSWVLLRRNYKWCRQDQLVMGVCASWGLGGKVGILFPHHLFFTSEECASIPTSLPNAVVQDMFPHHWSAVLKEIISLSFLRKAVTFSVCLKCIISWIFFFQILIPCL